MTATHITVASHKNKDFAVEDGLFAAENASVIGDGGTVGVDLSVFDVALRPDYKAQVISQYPILEGKTIFGYVGRIETGKRGISIDFLVDIACAFDVSLDYLILGIKKK